MEYDDATNLPISICKKYGIEILSYIDEPEEDFYCIKYIKRGE